MADNITTESVEKFQFEPIKGQPRLYWQGKRPFESTNYFPAQLKERYGDEKDGWMNKLYWGDNIQVMSHLLKFYRGEIDLIYIDPPYDSKADYKKEIKLKGKKISNDYSGFEEKQYTDIWSNDEYLQFMYERIILIRELLSDTGTLYLHCDYHQNHHLKMILNEVFGSDNLRNEIIWHYDIGHAPKKDFKKKHDTIYRYSKTGKYIYNEIRIPPTNEDRYNKEDKEGRKYMVRGDTGKKVYADEGQSEDDVWTYYKSDKFRTLNSMAIERREVNYPTQKPEALIERIIKASSNKGDIILDCFMGSGTTQAVAMKLGRKFIGADINLGSIQTTSSRLVKIMNEYKSDHTKSGYYNFEIYNVNNYDIFRNPEEAKDLLIEALEINSLSRSNIYDGEKDGRMVKIMPINRIATKADLNNLITNFNYKKFEKRYNENPNQPVEKLLLVCMGHEPDLAATLEKEVEYNLDIEIVDILRDKKEIKFKRKSEIALNMQENELKIERFYPLNLLQKLSLMEDQVEDWRELVESVLIDWDYNGDILKPDIVDVPKDNDLVKGKYEIPEKHGKIRVKVTDLLTETLEVNYNIN